jgi:hypothetical protein
MKTKNRLSLLLIVMIISGFVACDILNTDKEETDPEKTMGKEGNYWSANVPGVGATQITITENNDGNVVATIPYNGTNYEVEGKITDNGFYDYVYSNGDKSKPFPLVKFDASVGDKWEFKVGTLTVTREVVKKSTTDDTSYQGFWYIKTIDVLETVPAGLKLQGAGTGLKSGLLALNNGSADEVAKLVTGETQVKSILWKFNHKFGFIAAEVTKTDNTKVTINSNDTNVASF